MERVLASRWLKESQQLRGLLRHVVVETLEGRADGLKEYSLGLQVFHRPPDYDPRNDAIVRVQASLLRKRLAAYYEDEGRNAAVRIDLPRGGYVPVFLEGGVPAESPSPVQPGSRRLWLPLPVGLLLGVLLGAAGVWLGSRPGREPVSCPSIWGAFLSPGSKTVVSFGVPLFFSGSGGLYIRDTEVNQVTDDQQRITRIAESLGRRFQPQGDVYTGIGDAIGTYSVARWLERQGQHATVANSNYIGPSDVEGRNLVVVASARFQTLLQQMKLPAMIRFDSTRRGGGYVLLDPSGHETDFYPTYDSMGVSTSHAVVSLWPSGNGRHRVLYLSGIQTWATQGAAEYVLDPEKMADLQRRLDRDPEQSFRGRRSPFFQVLLRVEGKNNIVRGAAYVTHRYLPPAN